LLFFILTALAFQIDKRSGNNRILEINLSLKTDSIYFKINHSKGYYVRGKKSGYWIFYNEQRQISSAGEYVNNKKNNYWFFNAITGFLSTEGHF
jgi:hypothetical protein|tara:strand:+ start:1594 stop:1875 length:282 start_codon:yes stop_codon:yes gene_type:complete